METKPTRMYCTEMEPNPRTGEEWMSNFHPSIMAVRMCFDERRPLQMLEVEVSASTDPAGYWGWWDTQDQRFMMVFRREMLVEICFAYGSRAEEERGRGKKMPVEVKVIRKVAHDERDTKRY